MIVQLFSKIICFYLLWKQLFIRKTGIFFCSVNRLYFTFLRHYGYVYFLIERKNLFFSFLTKAVTWILGLKRSVVQSFVLLKFRVTLNNFFLIAHSGGELVTYNTCGISGFKGPARKSLYTVEVAAEYFVKQLRSKGILKGFLFLKGKVTRYIFVSLRILRRRGFVVSGVLYLPGIAHNGPRPAKMKRR